MQTHFQSFTYLSQNNPAEKQKLFPDLKEWQPAVGEEDAYSYLDKIGDKIDFIYRDHEKRPESDMPAGYTYFGQLISHDLSYFPENTAIKPPHDPDSQATRVPAFNLDCIYGGGLKMSPNLFGKDFKFLLSKRFANVIGIRKLRYYDFPDAKRNPLMADHRNDENIILSQLQIVFMLLHNKFVDRLSGQYGGTELFEKARQLTIWHYQYVLKEDYLNQIIGTVGLIDSIVNDYRNDPAGKKLGFVPQEFSGAAFRFGHSQIRLTYLLNQDTNPNLAILPDFRSSGVKNYVDWRIFFGYSTKFSKKDLETYKLLNETAKQLNKGRLEKGIPILYNFKIEPLYETKLSILDTGRRFTNLFKQDLLRGLQFKLPSGQAIAKAIKADSLVDWSKLSFRFDFFPGSSDDKRKFQENTPLFYYILAEARTIHDGKYLGPVGSYIVAETILRLMLSDPSSYINQEPEWKPNDEDHLAGSTFSMIDLIKLADAEEGVLVLDS